MVTGTLIAPPDAVQGQAQRLMYLHVPAAWTGFACFAAVLAASIAYLARGDLRWDRLARAAAEIGVVSTATAIAVGSLWGRLVWGVWWAWDPRLVSTAMLLVVYLGYLALRQLGNTPDRDAATDGDDAHDAADQETAVARRSAIAGIAGFALVPVVHFSVVWWRSLHQQATLLTPQTSHIHPLMLLALGLSLVTFTAGAAWLMGYRVRVLDRTAKAARATTTTASPTSDGAAAELSGAPIRLR